MATDIKTEMTGLRRNILSLGADVEHRVNRIVDAFVNMDIVAAREVRSGDNAIDRAEVDIEQECLRILALWNPVAKDLRFVLAVLRINTDLERIADQAKGIAKRLLERMDQSKPMPQPPKALYEMARGSAAMVHDVLSALADSDAAVSQRVRRSDQTIDDLNREVFAWVQAEIPAHVEETAAAIDYLSIARRFERIADHATNIAETVIFLAEGEVVRHKSIKQTEKA
ncbi:MAG: phosphate signaling complex protein PhoU [Phycisphaerales bacterium]